MENKNLPISQLPLATELDGTEILPFARSNKNGGILVSLLKSYIRKELAESLNALTQTVAELTIKVDTIKEKVDTIPIIPTVDGKCYALIDGAWTVIADSDESVAVVNKSEG